MDFKRKGPNVLMTLLSDARQGEEECNKPSCLRNSEKFKIGSTDAKGSTQD
jgi:hypothetical protein